MGKKPVTDPHRWEIWPHPYCQDYDYYVTDSDAQAGEAIAHAAEMFLWDQHEGGERQLKVIMRPEIPTSDGVEDGDGRGRECVSREACPNEDAKKIAGLAMEYEAKAKESENWPSSPAAEYRELAKACRASLRAYKELERLKNALGFSRAYPIESVLRDLTKSAGILLEDFDYDGDGWEQMTAALNSGRQMLRDLQAIQKENLE